MWFNKNDFNFKNKKIINEQNIYGYVVPHAGSKYTSNIYLHPFQFKPQRKTFDTVYIIYYPSQEEENVLFRGYKYFHEYYVPWKSCELIFKKLWNLNNLNFIGVNMKNPINIPTLSNSLIIISADFSHHYPMQKAIKLENKATHSLLFKTNHSSQKVVDDMKQFNYLFQLFPNLILKWIGRTRSSIEPGVGYLSFLITKKHIPKNPDGFFITAYDKEMNARECLGNWKYSKENVDKLLLDVYIKGERESRLTNGRHINIPVKHFIITYLYKDEKNNFIRGFHGVKGNAFYLSDVFLENTYENGNWIKPKETRWQEGNNFDMNETKQMLIKKSNIQSPDTELTFYKCYVSYMNI